MEANIGRKNKVNIIIDKEDLDRITKEGWSMSLTEHGYIFCNKYIGKIDGKYKYDRKYLHRIITGAPKHLTVDHIDRNPLNNSRSNLRVCTMANNNKNKRLRNGSVGVYWHKQLNKWASQITKNGKRFSVGVFTDKKEAQIAYNKMARKLHGKYARLNPV